MKSPIHCLLAVSLTVFSGVSFGQSVLYVSQTGNDAANDCQTPGNPCASVAYANTLISAGDTIKVAPGNYTFTSTLNLLEPVVISALDPNDSPVITTEASDFILVNSNDVTISHLTLEMGLTPTSGMRGIVGTSNFNNLKLVGNQFISTNPISGTPSANMVWNAFAIALTSTPGLAQTVVIEDNTIAAPATSNIFGRGIFLGNGGAGLQGPGGIISGNNITAYYTVQAVSCTDDLEIAANELHGILMVNAPLSGVMVDVHDNTFSGDTQMEADNLYALFEFRSIEDASLVVANNVFEDYSRIALLHEASRNVSVIGNTFNPLSTATDFVSVMVSTKIMTNGTQGNTYADEIDLLGNTFNAGMADAGTALLFADHYGVNEPAFGNVTIGSANATDKNVFAAGLGSYIVLDNQSGTSATVPLWASYAVTTMKPVSQDFTALAIHNNYNLVDFAAIEAKNTDVTDEAGLGKIIIKSVGTIRYVATTGSDVSNDCTQSAFPCETVAHALSVAEEANTVEVAAGLYPQTTILSLGLNGLTVQGADLVNKPVFTTNQPTLFDINATGVVLKGLRMELGLEANSGLYAVESTSNEFNHLTLESNEIISVAPGTALGMIWDAYAVKLFSTAGQVDTVTITNNTVGVADENNGSIFGRGIILGSGSADGASGTITGNDVTAFYSTQLIRSTGDVLVSDNHLKGITMVNSPKNGSEILLIANNLDAVTEFAADNLYALLDVRAIENGTVAVEENNFNNYTNIALLSMASKQVKVANNTFTPFATADEFVSVMVNTKLMTSGTQGNTFANEIELIGNNFEAGATDGGKAIVFADHYGATTPAFANVVIGGVTTELKNQFAPELGNYIVLDDQTGASNTLPLWAGYSVTTMKPVSDNIEALFVNNTYNFATTGEVELKNIDSLDNNILGKVILAYSFLNLDELTSGNIDLYPNPAVNQVTIALTDQAATASVSVIDLKGNVVHSAAVVGVQTIDVSNYQSGMYFVQLEIEGTTTRMRFIKE